MRDTDTYPKIIVTKISYPQVEHFEEPVKKQKSYKIYKRLFKRYEEKRKQSIGKVFILKFNFK
jgi:hypothetical protein